MKDAKHKYHDRLARIYEIIKYVYYNNNRITGYRTMRIFLKRYGYKVSNTTMHKYMNKHLNLFAVITRSKPGYKTGKKHEYKNSGDGLTIHLQRYFNYYTIRFFDLILYYVVPADNQLYRFHKAYYTATYHLCCFRHNTDV